MTDFAKRAFDHSFHIDPIVRSLMDTDFYKILTLNFAYLNHPNVRVGWVSKNRTTSVRLAEEVNIDELRQQLDHCRTLKFTPNELIWLTGQTFYGQTGIFGKSFIDYLRTFRLPDYELTVEDGQIVFRTKGLWIETSLWEIHYLSIVNELRYRAKMKTMSRSALDIMYARAKVKLYAKLEKLATIKNLNLTDFGTRRRHSFLWQEYCIQTAMEVLGDRFTGTSNCYLAMKYGLEAKGTQPHEATMTLAGLARDDIELKQSQYRLCQEWQNTYRGNLLVFLPDTFGTTQFLKGAPLWLADWTGARPDSKKPIPAGEELISYWESHNKDPKEKLIIFSDGMDVHLEGHSPQGEDILAVHSHFDGRVRVGFGWGTALTNDFVDCYPGMKPISLVCKVETVEDRSAVKLSDNYEKVTSSSQEETERYRRVFGHEGMANVPVIV